MNRALWPACFAPLSAFSDIKCLILHSLIKGKEKMIIDKIENLARYVALNPLFADVVAFLQHHDLRTLPNGSHPIHGDRLYVNVEDDLGKRREEAAVEYHRRMVDIQLPLNIPETYGFVPVDDLPPLPFDEDRDFAKSDGLPVRGFITLKPGEFVIFFPEDGHAPCIADGLIHKAVFKVAAD